MDETADSPAEPSGPSEPAAGLSAGPRVSQAAVDLAILRLSANGDGHPVSCGIAAAAARSAVALATAGRVASTVTPVTAAGWPPLPVRVTQAAVATPSPVAELSAPGPSDGPADTRIDVNEVAPPSSADWADDLDDLLAAREMSDSNDGAPPMDGTGDTDQAPSAEEPGAPAAPLPVPARRADDDAVERAAEAAHALPDVDTSRGAPTEIASREQTRRLSAGIGQGASPFALRPGDIYRHIPVLQPAPTPHALDIVARSDAAGAVDSPAAPPLLPPPEPIAEAPAPQEARRPPYDGARKPVVTAQAVAGDVAMEGPPPRTGTSPRTSAGRSWLRRSAKFAAYAFVGWLAVMFVVIAVLRFVDPPGSMLMLWRGLTGEDVEQRWMPLEKVSPNLVRAVVASEDARFCTHWGIDPREIVAAIERARDGVPRGASTISMQVAKNMFLWPSKSYLRKALEVPLTFMMEAVWGKRRILEVYLNVAEWGPGIYGAEAAARHHFRKPASRLSEREAALLAVALPNPIRRDAGDPGMGTARLARAIQGRMRSVGRATQCVERSR